MTELLVADRALRDIAEIEDYPFARWSRAIADKYIADIEAALLRIQEKPDLLRAEQGFHAELVFYQVNKHLLVCDRQANAIFLLTVVHANRDIPRHLAMLEPSLSIEAELLHQKLEQKKGR